MSPSWLKLMCVRILIDAVMGRSMLPAYAEGELAFRGLTSQIRIRPEDGQRPQTAAAASPRPLHGHDRIQWLPTQGFP